MLKNFCYHVESIGLLDINQVGTFVKYLNHFCYSKDNKGSQTPDQMKHQMKMSVTAFFNDIIMKEHNYLEKLTSRIVDSFASKLDNDKVNATIQLSEKLEYRVKERFYSAFFKLLVKSNKKDNMCPRLRVIPKGKVKPKNENAVNSLPSTNKGLEHTIINKISNETASRATPLTITEVEPDDFKKCNSTQTENSKSIINYAPKRNNSIDYKNYLRRPESSFSSSSVLLNSSFEFRQKSYSQTKLAKLIKLKTENEKSFASTHTFKPTINRINVNAWDVSQEGKSASILSESSVFDSLHNNYLLKKQKRIIDYIKANRSNASLDSSITLDHLKNYHTIKYK